MGASRSAHVQKLDGPHSSGSFTVQQMSRNSIRSFFADKQEVYSSESVLEHLGPETEEWFRMRNEELLNWAIPFVPYIIQQSFFEGALDSADSVIVHRGEGAVVFSDASGFTALTERLALKPNGAELLSQCLRDFFTPLIDIISAYRGDVIKFSGDALTIYFPAVDDTTHPRYRPTVPPHGSYGLPDIGPMATAVLRASACCIEIHKRLHMFETLVDGVVLCLHIGVGCGPVTILQVGGVVPPETKVPRYEYVIAGPPLEQISIAEPLAKNGETCLSPQAWKFVRDVVTEGRLLEEVPEFHILQQIDETKYTFPTVRNAAELRDSRDEKRFRLSELPLLRRYIPSAVFKQIECGTLTYVNEMRLISTIFISGSGVDVSTDEGSRAAQDLMAEVQRCCYAHEGTLNKYLVDDKGMLFLLVFGLPPMVHTDDATRAVLACLDMVEIFRRFGLTGRFGVTTGRNYCGLVGSARRMEYTVLGDTVNLAARLMANAGPLKILVDEETQSQSSRDVAYTELTPITVKGKSSLISIFEPSPLHPKELIGLTPAGISFPWKCACSSLGGKSKLMEVTNWVELPRIRDMLEGARRGQKNPFSAGGVFVVSGEDGMGKTELTEYIVTEMSSHSVPLFGTVGSRPRELFRPVQELLKSLVLGFRTIGSELPASQKQGLAQLSQEVMGDTFNDFVDCLQEDMALPGETDTTDEAMDLCQEGLGLVRGLILSLLAKRRVCCVLSLRSGSNIFASSNKGDLGIFWELASKIARVSVDRDTPNPLLLLLVTKGTTYEFPYQLRSHIAADAFVRMTPLDESGVLEYMSKYLEVSPEKIPEMLHMFVVTLTQGNALYVRETIEQMLQYGHLHVLKDHEDNPTVSHTEDLEGMNLKDWSNTAMIGSTVCLLESLDPLQSAVVKMATVFNGPFTVADLAASSCSKWAGACFFDAFRLFHAVLQLVERGIIDRARHSEETAFLGEENKSECFKLTSMLIRKVGEAMILEAQKKNVKRQALVERILAVHLPPKMEALRIRNSIQHIPWYYQINHVETKRDR